MEQKDIVILVICYVGILLIIIGIAIIPSQKDLKLSEMKVENGPEFDEKTENGYDETLNDYDRLKWQEELSDKLSFLGLAFIFSSITLAILRFDRQKQSFQPTMSQGPSHETRVRKPEDFLVNVPSDSRKEYYRMN